MMKNIYFVLLVLLISGPLFSQNFIDDEYAEIKANPENTVVFVSGKLFQMASQVIPEDKEIEEIGSIKELAGNVTSFNLVLDRTTDDPKSQYKSAINKLRGDYEELMSLKDNSNNISFYVDEEGGIIYELVGVGTTDENEFVVFSLTGEIDLDKVGTILSKIQKETKKEITTRSQPDIDAMKIYPNPTSTGQVMNIESPKELIGGKAMIYDLGGNLIHSYEIDKTFYQLNTNNYIPGKYIIKLQNGEVSMQKKVLVVQ
jgi:hypothetical protein